MALQTKQLDRLREDLKVHETRMSELQKQVSMLQDEIKVHDWIVRLGRNEKLMKKLDEYSANPDSAQSVAGKELETAKREGIELPPGCRVSVTRDAGSVNIFLEASQGKIPYTLTWNSRTGFSSGPDRRTF